MKLESKLFSVINLKTINDPVLILTLLSRHCAFCFQDVLKRITGFHILINGSTATINLAALRYN